MVQFSAVQASDDASVRACPDASGGWLASSIDIHRRSLTRTGFTSGLTQSSFDLILKDGSEILIQFSSSATVYVGSTLSSIRSLAAGEKVKMTGHLAPDSTVDASRIVIEP